MSDVETVIVSREDLLDGLEVRSRTTRATDLKRTLRVRADGGRIVLAFTVGLASEGGHPDVRSCDLLPAEARRVAALLIAAAAAAAAGPHEAEGAHDL